MLHNIHELTTLGVLWIGTAAQLLFVGLFFTRKWTKYRFSRALMWKSVALLLYLYGWWSKTLVEGLRPVEWPLWIEIQTSVINTIVLWAILNQLYALIRDILAGDRDSVETEVTEKAAEEQETP